MRIDPNGPLRIGSFRSKDDDPMRKGLDLMVIDQWSILLSTFYKKWINATSIDRNGMDGIDLIED